MKFILGIIIAGAPLFVVEALYRKHVLGPETGRKISHVASASSVLVLTLFLTLQAIAVIALIFVIVMLVTRLMRFWKSLYSVRRTSWGEILFPVGILLASLLAPDVKAFICAIAIMGFADTAAALVGIKYGRSRIGRTGKTVEGCIAFAVVASAVFVILQPVTLPLAILIISLTALTELISPYGIDNASVPLVLALLLRITM